MRDKEDHGSATVARRVGGSGQTDAAKIRVSGAGGDAAVASVRGAGGDAAVASVVNMANGDGAVASVVSGANEMCVQVRRDNRTNVVVREVIWAV